MKTIKEVYSLPDCKKCANTRTVQYVDKRLGPENRRTQCSCVLYGKNFGKLKRSRIPDGYLKFEFSDYRPDITDKIDHVKVNKKTHYNIVSLVGKHKILKQEGIDLLFVGGYSSGKTLLASVLLKELIMKYGYTGMFVTADEIVEAAYNKMKYEKIKNGLELEELIKPDFILIDGFDKLVLLQGIPTIVINYINVIVKKRKHMGKGFIMTSRQTLSQLRKNGQYISEMIYTVKDFLLYGKCTDDIRNDKLKRLGL